MDNIQVGDWVVFKNASSLPHWHRSMMENAEKLRQVTSVNSQDKTLKFEGSFIYKYFWNDVKEVIPNDKIEEYKKRFTPTLNNIYDLAAKIFTEDRVELSGTNLTIHFPKIEISNSKNLKHEIYDLFVRISLHKLEDGLYYPSPPSGTRTTFTPMEVIAGYSHSHLHVNYYDFNSFCLGSSQFSVLVYGMRVNYKNKSSWELFFRSLKNYVEWESIEGGPYILLSNMFKVKSDFLNQRNMLTGEHLSILRNITPNCLEINNKQIILNDQEFAKFITLYSKIKSYKNDESAMYLKANEKLTRNGITVRFKNKDFSPTLLKTEENNSTVDEVMQPSIIEDYKRSVLPILSNYKNQLKNDNFSKTINNIVQFGQSKFK